MTSAGDESAEFVDPAGYKAVSVSSIRDDGAEVQRTEIESQH